LGSPDLQGNPLKTNKSRHPMARAFDMNVLDVSSLGLGFTIFDLDQGGAFSFSHFFFLVLSSHECALRGVAFNVNDLLL
jgi:hypothetical protein